MEAFDCKCLKVNIGNTKVMASGDIAKNGLSKSKVYVCGVCSFRVNLIPCSVYNVVSGSTLDVLE